METYIEKVGGVKVNEGLVIGVIVTLVWFVLPILSILLILFLIYKLPEKLTPLKYFICLISISFGLIAYTAVSVDRGGEPTDITRYTTQFYLLSDVKSMGEFFIATFLTDGGVYIVFQLVTLTLAKIFINNPQVLPLFWVSVAYFFLGMGVVELSNSAGKPIRAILVLLLVILLFGTTLFTSEVELLKQSSAMAIASYALFRKLNGKSHWALFFIALLIHTSVFVYIPVIFILNKKYVLKYWIWVLVVSIGFSVVDLNKVVALFAGGAFADKANFYAGIDSITINKINYLLFFIYASFLFIHLWAYLKKSKRDTGARQLLTLNFLCFCILLLQMGSAHNFVRFNYLYSPFYLLALVGVLRSDLIKSGKIRILTFFLIVFPLLNVAYTIFYLNSTYTNSYMDNSLSKIMTSNVVDFLNFEAHN